MDSDAENLARVYAVMELLKSSSANWDDLVDLLAPFPGWVRLLEEHRYRRTGVENRLYPAAMPMDFTQLSEDSRRSLAALFQPFTILAAPDLSPIERAMALQEVGIDAKDFCKEHLNDGATCISKRAKETLTAIQNEASLLRAPHARSIHEDLLRTTLDPKSTVSASSRQEHVQLVNAMSGTPANLLASLKLWLRRRRR